MGLWPNFFDSDWEPATNLPVGLCTFDQNASADDSPRSQTQSTPKIYLVFGGNFGENLEEVLGVWGMNLFHHRINHHKLLKVEVGEEIGIEAYSIYEQNMRHGSPARRGPPTNTFWQ